MKKLTYIITGTGRCGTVFMARLLTGLGIQCGHEAVFGLGNLADAEKKLRGEAPIVNSEISNNDGEGWTLDDRLAADSSYLAAPFLNSYLLQDTPVIHTIRFPLHVINSFVFGFRYFTHAAPESLQSWFCPGNAWQLFIYDHLPILRSDLTVFERAAMYYVKWNEMIEGQCQHRPYFRHRIEDGPAVVADYLGLKGDLYRNNLANVKVSTKPYDFVPEGEAKQLLRAMAARYGYEL